MSRSSMAMAAGGVDEQRETLLRGDHLGLLRGQGLTPVTAVATIAASTRAPRMRFASVAALDSREAARVACRRSRSTRSSRGRKQLVGEPAHGGDLEAVGLLPAGSPAPPPRGGRCRERSSGSRGEPFPTAAPPPGSEGKPARPEIAASTESRSASRSFRCPARPRRGAPSRPRREPARWRSGCPPGPSASRGARRATAGFPRRSPHCESLPCGGSRARWQRSPRKPGRARSRSSPPATSGASARALLQQSDYGTPAHRRCPGGGQGGLGPLAGLALQRFLGRAVKGRGDNGEDRHRAVFELSIASCEGSSSADPERDEGWSLLAGRAGNAEDRAWAPHILRALAVKEERGAARGGGDGRRGEMTR